MSAGFLLGDGTAELSAEHLGLSTVGVREDFERRGEQKEGTGGERMHTRFLMVVPPWGPCR